VGAYLKKLSAPFFNFSELETVPGAAGQIPVNRPRNAGHGVYQGYEFSARSFFDFLPGIWKNFGAGVNGTIYQRYTVDLPEGKADGAYSGSNNAPNTSRYTANAELFYSTPKLDARVAYNYRSSYKGDPYYNYPLGDFDYRYTWTSRPTSRLDAAVSYTPFDKLTVMFEAANLLKNNNSAYFGYSYFPSEYRLQARTYQLGFRFKL
jgi:TonB-dependent receptor